MCEQFIYDIHLKPPDHPTVMGENTFIGFSEDAQEKNQVLLDLLFPIYAVLGMAIPRTITPLKATALVYVKSGWFASLRTLA